jgi:general secretion pathway protein I
LSRSANPSNAGFTLFEVLVALAIVALSLAAIGSVMATSIRGARSIDSHLSELEVARAVETALPDRDQLLPGHLDGKIANHSWRVDVSPFDASNLHVREPRWEPQTVAVTVQSPTGGRLQIETIRLRPRANP